MCCNDFNADGLSDTAGQRDGNREQQFKRRKENRKYKV